jgi:cell division protein FtsZ
VAPQPSQEEPEEEEREAAEATAQRREPAVKPQQRQLQPRMPAIEEFPPIAQRQLAAQQNRIEDIAEHANKKKRGLFERLAGVGLSRKGDLPMQREPELARAEPRPAQDNTVQPIRQAPQTANQIDPSFDDDQLEIPAFLRRQAN